MSLEELREQAISQELLEGAPEASPRMPYQERRIFGLTAFQRFFVALLIFLITCMVGSFLLLVTQRVVPPFF
jgi:hypothetical protein